MSEAAGTAGQAQIRVGVIGASPTRGWARTAHLPALLAMPERYRVTAVATRDPDTARRAGQEYGVASAYHDPADLIADPGVDLVTVAVRVPEHARLVTAALEAGKDVYCEWPLGRDAGEAEAVAELARSTGRRVAVGLQGRLAPQVARARDMIEAGRLGRVTSVTGYSGLRHGYGGVLPDGYRWTLDAANGGTVLTIIAGHMLDIIASLADPITSASGLAATQMPDLKLMPSGQTVRTAAPDHAFITGVTMSGALVCVIALTGKAADPRTVIEIEGTNGTLRLRSTLPIQVGAIDAKFASGEETELRPLPAPVTPDWAAGLTSAALTVGQVYRALSEPPGDGFPYADAEVALRLHRLLDTIGDGELEHR